MNEEIEKIFQVASEKIDEILGPINDDRVLCILLKTAREFGYRIFIFSYLLKTKTLSRTKTSESNETKTNESKPYEFYEFKELDYELEFHFDFSNSSEFCYVIEYEISLNIVGTMFSRECVPSLPCNLSPLEAYHVLRHALSMAKFQIWKKNGKDIGESGVIEEAPTCDFTEIPPSITAFTLSGSDTKGLAILGCGGSLRWNYRILNSKRDLISYSKDYLLKLGSPIYVKLVFNKSFLNDKLEPSGPSNLELIRSLKGYISCTMKTLEIEKK
jgi:hypothetical protein